MRRTIREQDPLKQGLKRWAQKKVNVSNSIREQDPLKQGLKPSEAGTTYTTKSNS